MSQFDDFNRMILQMMRDFGGYATLRSYSDGVYSDGEFTNSFTEYFTPSILLEFAQIGAGEKSGFNNEILKGDRQCFLKPIATTGQVLPKIKANKDTVVIGGVEWTIQGYKEVNSTGYDLLLIELHIRK